MNLFLGFYSTLIWRLIQQLNFENNFLDIVNFWLLLIFRISSLKSCSFSDICWLKEYALERRLNHIVFLYFFSPNYYVEVNGLLRIDNNLFGLLCIYEGMAWLAKDFKIAEICRYWGRRSFSNARNYWSLVAKRKGKWILLVVIFQWKRGIFSIKL